MNWKIEVGRLKIGLLLAASAIFHLLSPGRAPAAAASKFEVRSSKFEVQHKGAHREPVKVRDASGRVRIIYPKKAPPLPFKAAPVSKAEAQKRAKALAAPMTPVPLWLVWQLRTNAWLPWYDPNPRDTVQGYRVYAGFQSKEYSRTNEVGREASSGAWVGLLAGTNFFKVTVFDLQGESDGSEEVFTTPLFTAIVRSPPVPSTPNPIGVFVVQSRGSVIDPWVTLTTRTNQGSLALSATTPRFFRVGVLP